MTLNLRRMRKYHPRRSSKEIKLNKQKLIDLEHQIKADIGEFLLLMKEGSQEDTLKSYQKTKGNLLKYRPDMEKVAEEIGGRVPKYVDNFLQTVDQILQTPDSPSETLDLWVDDAKVRSCFNATQKLENLLFK